MPISEYQTPKPVSLVGDPVVVSVLTDAHLVAGSKTIMQIQRFNDNDTITFNFDAGETVEVFTMVDELTGDHDILNESNFPSANEFIDHVIDRISAIYSFSSRFTFTDLGTFFKITSINNLAIEIEIVSGFSYDYVISYQLGAETVYVDGYRLGINVYNENTELIGTLEERPPIDGIVNFNISEFLEILPDPGFDFDGGILSYSETCKPYKYEIYEKYGIPAIQHDKVLSDIYYAIYGKSSYMQGGKWNEEFGSFYNEIILNKAFLTLQPNYKKISPFAPEMISFLVFDETISTIKLHLTVNFSDASTYEVDISSIGGVKGKVLQCNISPELLDLFKIDVNKTVNNYSVVLRNQADADISRERTYIIDYDTYDYVRFFIFLNQYGGGYDCMRSTGQVVEIGKIDKEFAQKVLAWDYTTKDRQETQVSAKRTQEFNLNWGLLKKNGGDPRNWKNFIQQIEMSFDVYEYINSLTVPCSFITDQYNLHDDNRRIYTHTSVYRRAFVDEAYSDDDIPVIGDFGDDWSNDYF